MFDRLKLGSFGMLKRRYEKIGAFGAAHSDSIILAALTSSDFAERFPFDSSTLVMSRRKDRFFDNFKSFVRIIFIVKFYTGRDIIRAGLIQSCAGTIDKNIIIIAFIFKNFIIVELFGVALNTIPNAFVLNQRLVAIDTNFSFF